MSLSSEQIACIRELVLRGGTPDRGEIVALCDMALAHLKDNAAGQEKALPREPGSRPVEAEVARMTNTIAEQHERAEELQKMLEHETAWREVAIIGVRKRAEAAEAALREARDHPIARLQVGPDGIVPTGTVEALELWKAEADRLFAALQRKDALLREWLMLRRGVGRSGLEIAADTEKEVEGG